MTARMDGAAFTLQFRTPTLTLWDCYCRTKRKLTQQPRYRPIRSVPNDLLLTWDRIQMPIHGYGDTTKLTPYDDTDGVRTLDGPVVRSNLTCKLVKLLLSWLCKYYEMFFILWINSYYVTDESTLPPTAIKLHPYPWQIRKMVFHSRSMLKQ